MGHQEESLAALAKSMVKDRGDVAHVAWRANGDWSVWFTTEAAAFYAFWQYNRAPGSPVKGKIEYGANGLVGLVMH